MGANTGAAAQAGRLASGTRACKKKSRSAPAHEFPYRSELGHIARSQHDGTLRWVATDPRDTRSMLVPLSAKDTCLLSHHKGGVEAEDHRRCGGDNQEVAQKPGMPTAGRTPGRFREAFDHGFVLVG